MAHCKPWILICFWFLPLNNRTGGISLRSTPGAVLESPTVSQTLSTSSDLLSAASAQYTEPPSAEALEVVIKPFNEPKQASGARDAIVEDERNPQDINIPRPGGDRARIPSVPAPQSRGRSPHNTPPQPDVAPLPCKCHVSLCFS